MSSSRIVWAWKCQNWPMKVSKDHILKQNENAYCKCSCRRMKCKREEDAWNKFEEIGMACAQAWQAQIEKSSRPGRPHPWKHGRTALTETLQSRPLRRLFQLHCRFQPLHGRDRIENWDAPCNNKLRVLNALVGNALSSASPVWH